MTIVDLEQPPIDRGDPNTAALALDGLRLAYDVRGNDREVLRGVTFQIRPGEAFGLVGESGCGKSTSAYAAMRYLPGNGRITGGRILVDGADVTNMSNEELRTLRATKASMIYQDPVQAMNPSLKIGKQVAECFTVLGISKDEASDRALDSFDAPEALDTFGSIVGEHR